MQFARIERPLLMKEEELVCSKMLMVVRHLKGKPARLWLGAFLCWACLMLATPRIPQSPKYHVFADKRNFFGVPNTLNVISNFPFLVVGVLGLVLSLHGNYFGISLRGEVWGWAFFYAGTAATAFGSAHYHLKPEDARVLWDRLPMMVAFTSLLSSFIVERVDERIGATCFVPLLAIVFLSVVYERVFNDLRMYMMFHLIPCVAIPAMAILFPPKYTHSRYWFWAAGFYVLAKIEAAADKKIYNANRYIISGHSLEHLCLAMVPILLTVMLLYRNIKIERLAFLRRVRPYIKMIGGKGCVKLTQKLLAQGYNDDDDDNFYLIIVSGATLAGWQRDRIRPNVSLFVTFVRVHFFSLLKSYSFFI